MDLIPDFGASFVVVVEPLQRVVGRRRNQLRKECRAEEL